METENKIKPISIWRSIVLFGIPGLLAYMGLIYGIPCFQKFGLKDIFLFPFFLWIPIIPLLPISILLFKKEKKYNCINPKLEFSERFRLKYGKYAWLVNGLFWGYFVHFVMRWNFISFLQSMLITPFIAQKTKNTWMSLMIHGVPNTILWIIILSGILGIE